jgi:N-dimethylarginine dimethylaminohydrolase
MHERTEAAAVTPNGARLQIEVLDDTAPLQSVVMHVPSPPPEAGAFRAAQIAVAHEMKALRDAKPSNRRPTLPLEVARFFSIDPFLRAAQVEALATLLRGRGIEVLETPAVEGCIGQLFARDIAFAVGSTLFLANPERSDRRREVESLTSIAAACDDVVLLREGVIEGGDVAVLPDTVLVGIGEKTELAALHELAAALAERGARKQILPIEIAMQGVIHLDCVFNALSPDLALVFPPAIAPASLTVLHERFELIEMSLAETCDVRINTLSLGPRTIVLHTGSDRLAAILRRRGFEVIALAYDEVGKAFGGFRCTTLPLRRG